MLKKSLRRKAGSRLHIGYVFYEVKFRKRKISREVIDEEIQQVKNTGLDCYKYVFFSRSGFTADETDEIKHVELARLYE